MSDANGRDDARGVREGEPVGWHGLVCGTMSGSAEATPAGHPTR